MPPADQVLAGLRALAEAGFGVAVLWHVLVAAGLVLWARGWRPEQGQALVMIALPIASASLAAWVAMNPFNGAVLALIAAGVVRPALGSPRAPVSARSGLGLLAGLGLVGFAWVYPHFLAGHSPLVYLYAAPMGLLPCPSLALALGLALALDLGAERSHVYVLAAGGLFYGLFGVLRLGVLLDLPLVLGAILVLARARRPRVAELLPR